jgi:hypothetical protein
MLLIHWSHGRHIHIGQAYRHIVLTNREEGSNVSFEPDFLIANRQLRLLWLSILVAVTRFLVTAFLLQTYANRHSIPLRIRCSTFIKRFSINNFHVLLWRDRRQHSQKCYKSLGFRKHHNRFHFRSSIKECEQLLQLSCLDVNRNKDK